MSDYLYAVIPYKGTSLYSPDELEEGLSEPIIPELKGIYSEYAEEDGLKLFADFLLINTSGRQSWFTNVEDGYSQLRAEIYQIAKALGASEVWYVAELATDEMYAKGFSFDDWTRSFKDGTRYASELTVDVLKDKYIYSYYHDDFSDIILENSHQGNQSANEEKDKHKNEIVRAVFNIDYNSFKSIYDQGNFDASLCQDSDDLPYPLHFVTICWDMIFSHLEEWKEKYKPILRKRKEENDKFKTFFETECGLDMSNIPFSDYWDCFFCAEPDEDVEECLYHTVEELHNLGLRDCDIELAMHVYKFHFDEVEKLLKQGADPLKNMTDEEGEYDDCVTRIYREVQFMYSEITDEVLGQRMILGEERDFNDLMNLAAHEKMDHLLDEYHSNHKE